MKIDTNRPTKSVSLNWCQHVQGFHFGNPILIISVCIIKNMVFILKKQLNFLILQNMMEARC